MTTAAWLMLGGTWGVVLWFTVSFFWKVVRTPPRESGEADGGPPV